MAKSKWNIPWAHTYNGSVAGTKIEVDDNASGDGILIHSICLLNATANEAYFQVFNADADDVTVGTTTPTFVLGVDTAQQAQYVFDPPIFFDTGFTVASTTARAGSTGAAQETTITYSK